METHLNNSLSPRPITEPTLSIVVPCHNEADCLQQFAAEVSTAIESIQTTYPGTSAELLFVNDGSTDATLQTIKSLQTSSTPYTLRWISFSRNFGKEAALLAGLENARGTYVAIMDADLQDPPSLLPEMFAEIQTGTCDCVAARRATRTGEPVLRSFFARLFYKFINAISDTQIEDGARDFRLMTRKMVDAVLSVQERNRFSKGIFSWVGFETKWIEYNNIERAAGQTNWSFSQLLRYSFDGIAGFSVAPLALASYSGITLCFVAIVFLIIVVVRALLFGDPVAGWPSTIAIILLLGGLQMLFLGIFGQYLAKTYTETKQRPLYIVSSTSEDFTDARN